MRMEPGYIFGVLLLALVAGTVAYGLYEMFESFFITSPV